MNKLDVKKDVILKPVFDGRLHFHEMLKNEMINYMNMMSVHDYHGAIDVQRRILSMIGPYVGEKNTTSIKDDLVKARAFASSGKFNRYVSDRINDIYDSIHTYGKHLFLPSNEDEEETWESSKDQFFAESDL